MGRKRSRADAPEDVDDDDGGDDGDLIVRKKKKKKKKAVEAEPVKLGGMKPKVWTPQMLAALPPARRMLWLGAPTAADGDSEAARQARRRLGLRVPDVGRQPCKFWAQGRCERGDACSFAHTAEPRSSGLPRCPPPIDSLSDPGLPRCIGRAMLHFGHREPSPIQAQAWPAALEGHDLLCRAPTGSGKTLAYLLPAMAHVIAAGTPPAGQGPAALVLVPTRELAMQILGVCRALYRPCGVRVEALYGGEPREEQVEAMEMAVSMVIATAGRLTDMLTSGHVKLGRVGLFVLDEADQLLTLGFAAQVGQIVSQLRPDRQTLLFSATLSERLERAAGGNWLHTPIRVYADEVGSREGAASREGDEGDEDGERSEGDAGSDAGDDEGREAAESAPSEGACEEAPSLEQLSAVPSTVVQRFVLCGGGGRSSELLRVLEELGHTVGAEGSGPEERGAAEGSASARPPAKKAAMRNVPRVMVFLNEIASIRKLSVQVAHAAMGAASPPRAPDLT